MTDALRLFAAFEPPELVRGSLSAAAEALDSRFFRVLKRENFHITLAFLGDTPREALDTVRACLEAAAEDGRSFEAVLGGLDAFPHPGEPRVVWCGLAAGWREAGALALGLRRRLTSAGISFDAKPFKAHITLAYAKKNLDRAQLGKAGEALRAFMSGDGGVNRSCAARESRGELSFPVTEIVLMNSVLGPGGSVFTPLFRAKLGGDGAG